MEILKKNGLSEREIEVIISIVNQNQNCSLLSLIETLQRVFGNRIKTLHLVILGVLIGENLATEKSEEILNHNFYNLCQRQN